MAVTCMITPLVDKKPSILYGSLLEKTGNNRPLSNFLYAVSLHPDIKKHFNKKEFDKLGEIRIEALDRVLHIDNYIPEATKIQQYKEELKAIDNKGVPIEYDNPNDIVYKVMEFNDNHGNYAAKIEEQNGKYIITVDTINANNYNQNYYYKRNMARMQAILGMLNTNLNLNIDFSEETESFFNFLNPQLLVNLVTHSKSNGKDGRLLEDEKQVKLILELFKNDNNLKRLKENLSEDQLIRLLMHESYSDPSKSGINLNDIENLDYFKSMADNLLDTINYTFNAIPSYKFIDVINQAETAITNDKEVFEVKATDIKKTLKDLYSKFHLNAELKDVTTSKLKTLKEVAEAMLYSREKAIRLLESRQDVQEAAKEVRKYKKEIEQAKYAKSIQGMLDDIYSVITYFDNTKNTLPTDKYQDITEQALRDKCKYLNDIKSFLEENTDFINRLLDAESLKKATKDDISSPELIKNIVETATSIHNIIGQLRNYYVEQRFTTVYNILKHYWGDVDERIDNKGNIHSLEKMLRVADIDINAFDRWVFSMGQCSDEVLTLVHQVVLDSKRKMNERLRTVEYLISEETEKLYNAGYDSDFCFVRDEEGVPTGHLISNINWQKWKEDIQNYRKSLEKHGKYSKTDINNLVEAWKNKHLEQVELFKDSYQFKEILEKTARKLYGDNIPDLKTFQFVLPKAADYGDTTVLDNLSQVQREYYYSMMALKVLLSETLPFSETDIFRAVQISGDTLNQIENAENILDFLKNKAKDIFTRREDDTEYGDNDFTEMLAANGVVTALSDANNHEIMRIPLMFRREIKDKRRLSTNMSKGMFAWAASAIQYVETNKISDTLLLTRDYLTDHKNGRQYQANVGGKKVIDIVNYGKDLQYNTVNERGTLKADDLLYDFTERALYGKYKKKEKTVSVFGIEVSLDKAADALTRYTSFTGLSVNVMGAQANYLVGKLQMVIEGSCGEFFNMKDYGIADLKYFQMLPELMNELNSNNKKSKLALLGNYFDVTDDFIEKAKEKGFNKDALKRILNNPNWLFLYGMGEHALHYQTMLAVLNHIKVKNKKTGITTSLLDAFEVKLSESKKNGMLDIDVDNYEIEQKDKKNGVTYKQLTKDDILQVTKIIKYCNTSMHGAFGTIDRGMIHKYAAGRLIMNFRQWMPAHYARRFQGMHYDADLGQYREGYYVTCWKFLKDTLTDKDVLFNMKANWHRLSEPDKANIKRAITEVSMYMIICAQIAGLGTYKDKKGNWAYRNLMYQLRRLRMETGASMPGPYFINNIFQILNSPIAAISALQKASVLFHFTNVLKEVEGGKHKGENLYMHKLEKGLPLYGQVKSQLLDFATEDYLFNIFEKGY